MAATEKKDAEKYKVELKDVENIWQNSYSLSLEIRVHQSYFR